MAVQAVRAYFERPCPNNMLLIVAPALEQREMEAQWVSAVDRVGAWCRSGCKERELIAWAGGAIQLGLEEAGNWGRRAAGGAGQGNRAAQEIEKLVLLRQKLARSSGRSSGQPGGQRPLRRLCADRLTGIPGLGAEFVSRCCAGPPTLVLWVLARELRCSRRRPMPWRAARRPVQSIPLTKFRAPARTWSSERYGDYRSRLRMLLHRCARIDRAIKGLTPGDPWQGLAAVRYAPPQDRAPRRGSERV